MNKEKLVKEIFNRYGTIKRARNCYLYTQKGKRLTDLWQEDGRAILGWGGNSAFTMLKNALGRGANGSFITDYNYQLEKACSALLNSPRKILCLKSSEKALNDGAVFYKPWIFDENNQSIKWADKEAVLIEPPLPWATPVYLLAFKSDVITENSLEALKCEYESDEIYLSAPMMASYSRAIYNMIQALQERQEKDWFLWDTALRNYFVRKGPYLYSKLSEKDYEKFVLHCLDLGIVLNPDVNKASIVPFGADTGILNSLKKNPFILEN